MTVNRSTVVKASSSHFWGPGLNPWSIELCSVLMHEIVVWKQWGWDHEFMWWWRQLALGELARLREWEQWNWFVLADSQGWVVSLSYCLCGDLLEVGSLAKGSRMLGWLGQLPDGQETSVGWEQDGLGWEVVLSKVSVQSTCWMDAV